MKCHVAGTKRIFLSVKAVVIQVDQLWNSIIEGAIRIDQATEARTINET